MHPDNHIVRRMMIAVGRLRDHARLEWNPNGDRFDLSDSHEISRSKIRAIGQFGSKRVAVRVFAACRGFVSPERATTGYWESFGLSPQGRTALASLRLVSARIWSMEAADRADPTFILRTFVIAGNGRTTGRSEARTWRLLGRPPSCRFFCVICVIASPPYPATG